MEKINIEEVMEKLDMFQSRFGRLEEFDWWNQERIQTDSGSHFTSKDFQEGLSLHVVRLILAATDHQDMNGQIEVTWRTLQTIAHSIMVHARVLDK